MRELLLTHLQAAVPLFVKELQEIPIEVVMEGARRDSRIVAEKGDLILFKTKRKGESAKAVTALARGLAALSFAPGGVRFMGQTWESQHKGENP